jgi:hypothetical protein
VVDEVLTLVALSNVQHQVSVEAAFGFALVAHVMLSSCYVDIQLAKHLSAAPAQKHHRQPMH